MKMANLSLTSPNMSSIVEVCDRLGKTFLTSLVGNHLATSGLQVNSTSEYNLSVVTARGEYNIADHTKGGRWPTTNNLNALSGDTICQFD